MDELLGEFWDQAGYRSPRSTMVFVPRVDVYYCGEDAPEKAIVKVELPLFAIVMAITDPDGDITNEDVTTKVDGKQVVVASTEAGKTGRWTARETLPAPTARGRWTITSVQCNGNDKDIDLSDGPDGTTWGPRAG